MTISSGSLEMTVSSDNPVCACCVFVWDSCGEMRVWCRLGMRHEECTAPGNSLPGNTNETQNQKPFVENRTLVKEPECNQGVGNHTTKGDEVAGAA